MCDDVTIDLLWCLAKHGFNPNDTHEGREDIWRSLLGDAGLWAAVAEETNSDQPILRAVKHEIRERLAWACAQVDDVGNRLLFRNLDGVWVWHPPAVQIRQVMADWARRGGALVDDGQAAPAADPPPTGIEATIARMHDGLRTAIRKSNNKEDVEEVLVGIETDRHTLRATYWKYDKQ